MIKKFSITAALIAAIATLFVLVPSCSKEKAQDEDSIVNPASADGEADPSSETPGEQEEPAITILRVGLPEEQESSKAVLEFGYLEEFDTKVAIEQNDAGNLHTKWVADDALRVGGKKSDDSLSESVYDIQEGFTDHIAEFAGTAPTGATKDFYVIYPASVSYNLIYSYDYNGVKQVGNEGTSHLNYCAMMEGFDELPESLLLTSRYATEHGLELKRSSTIKYRLKLPAEATTPTRIEFKADKVGAQEGSDRIFYFNNTADSKINTLTLYLQEVTPVSQVLTAYMSIPWQGYSVASGQTLTISVFYTTASGDNKVVSKTFTPGAKTFGGNQTIIYQLNMTTGQSVATDTGGDGSSDHPYLLSTPEDMLSMKGKLLNGQKVYFKMTADIDMADIANWSPLNDSEINGFNRYIDFDGDGHLIKNLRCSDQKYASFFGVLCGECRNTGFVDANVNASGTSAGIVAAYLGLDSPTKTAETGVIDQCYTSGYVTTNNSSVGGLAGQVGALSGSTKSTISNSYSSAVVEGNSCGGLTGYLKEGSLIQGSYFCGVNVSPGPYWMGGIAAKTYSDGYDTKPIVNQCASLTKTSIAPHSGNNNVVFRIVRPNGMTVTNCKVWNGTNGNLRYSSDTQTNTLSEVQSLFTTTLGSANGWSTTLDGDYPLLSWQVSRGDYATYAGHGRDYFDGGDGSSSDPFLISKAYQLYNIEEHLNNSDTTYFKLAADVDLAAIDNWSPINKSNSDLLIDWDGNNKELSNLNMTVTSGYAGLFGILEGKVSDLTLKDFSVTQTSNNHGGILAGFLSTTAAEAYARVKNVTIDGGSVTMNGNGGVGSFGGNCGYAYLSGCSSSATVVQNSNSNDTYGYAAGGLVGSTRHSTLTAVFENCSFSGSLTGYKFSGGILGLTSGGAGPRITECTFSGTVTNRARAASTGIDALTADSAGGIVGYHSRGILTDCTALAAGSVSGNDCIGGIVGQYYHETASFSFEKNNNYAAVSGHDRIGGIVGSVYSTQGSQISDCHSYFAEEKSLSGNGSYCAGIIGWLRCIAEPASGYTISNCSSSARVQLTGSGNYAAGIIGYVAQDGSGTAHSILSMNNCSSSGIISSGNNSCGGLIGGMRGKIFSMTNCSSSAAISADATYAGGLVAYLSGAFTSGDEADISISDCSFSGTVSAGSNRAGGLFGEAYECPGTVVRCRTVNPQGSSVSVSSARWAGGLIGSMSTNATLSLSDCSSQGTVAVSDTTAGGIIGRSASKKLILDHCVNTASVTIAGSGESSENTHRDAGGVIGYLYGGNFADDEDLSITDCSNSGSITAAVNCGGIIGRATACTLGSSISGCANSGNITSRYRHSGGIIGYSVGSTFTLSECGTTGTPTILSANYSGGLVGRIGTSGSITLSDCQTSGSINSSPYSSAGGLVGASYTTLSITDCRSSANVTSSDKYAGGLVGYAINSTLSISNSFSSGNIQAVESAGGLIGECRNTLTLTASGHNTGYIQYNSEATYVNDQICSIGGLVGRICGSGTISRCFVKDCDVSGPCCIGGLVGYFGPTDSSTPTLSIKESYYHGGTIQGVGNGNTRAAGGILGKNYENPSSYANTVIEDCYTRGTISTTSGQVMGGIVGEAMKGITVSYCISDCAVSAQRCAGGIIGRACNGGWTYSNDGIVKVERCICWSPSVTSTATGDGSASSGAVIGFTSKLNWLYKCYYNPNMTFSGINVKNTLVQQNAGGGYNTTYDGATAAIVPGTTAGTWTTSPYTYVMPYHGGTVANSGRSACTVAQAIGFASRVDAESQTIWNLFSGGTYNPNFIMPELNHLRESSDTVGSISDMNNNPIFEEGDF